MTTQGLLLALLLGLLYFSSLQESGLVLAQDAEDETDNTENNGYKKDDIEAKQINDPTLGQKPQQSEIFSEYQKEEVRQKYGGPGFKVSVDSIEPEGGPTTGNTRVLVRGGPFRDLQILYPKPKCKFGRYDMVVDATYVLCTTSPTLTEEREAHHKDKNDTCLQCDNSPEQALPEIVPFSVSLTGDFSDTINSLPYRFYKPTIVHAIYPRYGPKDGQTFVQVWGENFLNFDENTRCNFGSKSVIAHFISNNYMTCISPFSDVVEKAIPFSVSLNKQQNSREKVDFWYYNWPQITEFIPNYGPEAGGNRVLVKGNNFNPFYQEAIDNANDTFFEFEGIGKIPGYVINSTKMWFIAPQNYILDKTIVELTLNNQQYTDDNTWYYYYKPPVVFDIDPREGPTKGGTKVYVYGNKYKESKNITCKFGDKLVRGTFLDPNRILCVSPQVERPGYVSLTVSYEGERYSSDSVQYLYYESPEIFNITPTCGPVTGYTQITVFGKNFINMGFGRVKCIFNLTYIMNATIMEENIIKCDSPPLPPNLGYAELGQVPWYNVSITMNGKEITESKIKFVYYVDPQMKSILPYLGPLKGNTTSKIRGEGFNQEGVCNVTVRYGQFQQKLLNYTDTELIVQSPPAQVPDAVVVSIALNGQQFITDKTLHYRDVENTFIYYQDLYIQDFYPKTGPTTGKTRIRVQGMGFRQFKNDDGTRRQERLYARFRDSVTGEFFWKTPPADFDTKAILEYSYNLQDWHPILDQGKNYSYLYYNAPRVQSVTPSYGPVKSPNNETVDIIGKNFQCPDAECKDLLVRFGDPRNGIYIKCDKIADDRIRCRVPKYTKPDVLPVEVSFNAQDFTNDNVTYGFFDPFILDVQPRLIGVKGTTRVRLIGFGFVNAGTDLRTRIGHVLRGNLKCYNGSCIQQAEYIDKSQIESGTYPQKDVNFEDGGDNIKWEGMAIEASVVVGNSFTENNIEIWYYEQPDYLALNTNGTPQNQEKPIFIKTNFKWQINSPFRFYKYGNFSCRFQSLDGKRVKYTRARMEIYPLASHDEGELPTHMFCQSPDWHTTEAVKLDISVNGQEYAGDFTFHFSDPLDLYRAVPMAGPNEGNTKVKLFGSGFNTGQKDVHLRWGVVDTEQLVKAQVLDYIWSESDFVSNTLPQGNEILQAYKKEAFNIEKKDFELFEGQKIKTYAISNSPKLNNWNRTHGGPIYLSVGEHLEVNITNYTYHESEEGNVTNITTIQTKTLYHYQYAFVEYYYYITPVVKKVEPKSGLTRGGTRIELSGAWFAYKPEYGIVPHCRIGNKVTRAKFYSTVRIVCTAAPNEEISMLYPVYVSLNGVDYVDTGFTFRYYEQPNLSKMTPICGPSSGGTNIYINGTRFSNISDPQHFNCKFTSLDRSVPPKYIPAFYYNLTTIMCSSPGGWGRGDSVKVQVTFNGEDYSENNFTFYYYNIIRAFPRSGPADGTGGPIRIEGSGFRNFTDIYCSLDNVLYEPLSIQPDLILCPMVKSKQGPDYFGPVNFAIIIDGNWHKFTGGFQYYEQIIVEDMNPKVGPSEGRGIIFFHGRNFREDYPLSDVGCRIGEAVGRGKVLSATSIRCVVEEMALVDEGFSLPATVALNSYSWPDSNQTFVPYGITAIYPNAGPYDGNTDILIVGKGFSEDNSEKARCKFGIQSDFAIVEAEVLSYDKMICRSPGEFKLPATSDETLSVPFGIGFLDEDFEPWTESIHRFRYYKSPGLLKIDPDEVEVGKMAEVYVIAEENSEFWEPIPTSRGALGQYGIECKFGRFGIGIGMYVNRTAIRCVTPSVSDDPESIWRETVKVTVALNGQDFDEETSDLDFTFVGTGTTLVFWPYVIGTLLIGLLLIALIVFCSALLQKASFERVIKNHVRGKTRPYVIRDPYDQFTSRAYTAGQMGVSNRSPPQ